MDLQNARKVADEGLDGHSDGCADQSQALATQLPQQRAECVFVFDIPNITVKQQDCVPWLSRWS